ncbi:MAG: hypothetical protein IKI12_10180 [Lachnospiraceae bacterium]|nr:hypothetical protein [Lachnospiraceae bacterium]MBR6399329.1 hypothetical protein [Lachnospiraceae bacterium]MBR7016799.1 hypothetical protein [Lachnospiraceae bacterium]
MFAKRVDIFKKKDKEAWESVKKALDEGGFKDYKAGHYLQESVMAGGCGAKLDPRDFGGKGRIDREVYFVKVKEKDKEAALAILRANAIVPSVETESIMTDAALRKHPLI